MDYTQDFSQWLADRLETLIVDLRIPCSAKVPTKIETQCAGVSKVLQHYSVETRGGS